MKWLIYSLLFGIIFTNASIANSTAYSEDDTLKILTIDPEPLETNFEENLDSLMLLWYISQSLNDDSLYYSAEADTIIPDFPDSVYLERIANIPSVVELSYNTIVRNYIDMYSKKKRKSVEVMLGLAEYYFPIFDEIFDYYNVPNEMKYMSIIESALNPRAYSRARAVGLWQFMYGTGKVYGLTVNSLVDERMDPVKATHAAARFASDLYSIYHDWILVIAAYNCGPGNVNKAIRRSGGKTNYWDLYYYLPRETRGHVPAFIAAAYIMNYYNEHNLKPRKINLPLANDTIMVNENLHLKQVAEVLNIPLQQLRDMNPQYRTDIIPGKGKSYTLRLPLEHTVNFISYEDSIFSYKDSVFFNPESLITSPTTYKASSNNYAPPGDDYANLHYTVKSGDNLGYISEWYNVRLSDLRYWNNIRRNIIRAGQKLDIYVPKSKVDKYKDINTMTFAQKQATVGKTVGASTSSAPAPINLEDDAYIYYTVKSGDSIWTIAQKYPGISDTDIIRLNNIKNPDAVKPGQRLKIKPK